MKLKKSLISVGAVALIAAPAASTVAFAANADAYTPTVYRNTGNHSLNIYASRTADVDNLMTLGYVPKYVQKTFGGDTLPKYLSNYANKDFVEKLNDEPQWSHHVTKLEFNGKNISTAFLAGFQSRLYNDVVSNGVDKTNIGYATMNEKYIPDMEYRIAHGGDQKAVNDWNNEGDNIVNSWGTAEASSETMKKTMDSSDLSGRTFDFNYTADIKKSLSITAGWVDRIKGADEVNNPTDDNSAVDRANKIENEFDARIASLRSAANVGNKTTLLLKPNRNHTPGDPDTNIIDPHFAWDPTIMPFMYSDDLGLGYNMPDYNGPDSDIQFLEDDADGLALAKEGGNVDEKVKNIFTNEVDDLYFLEPTSWVGKENSDEIANEIKSMTRSNSTANVHVVNEDLWYSSGFGMLGYFQQMDAYADMFGISDTAFPRGEDNWGWKPVSQGDYWESLAQKTVEL